MPCTVMALRSMRYESLADLSENQISVLYSAPIRFVYKASPVCLSALQIAARFLVSCLSTRAADHLDARVMG